MMHRYFVIDDELVWEMVTVDVPALLPQLHALLEIDGGQSLGSF